MPTQGLLSTIPLDVLHNHNYLLVDQLELNLLNYKLYLRDLILTQKKLDITQILPVPAQL